ncbi:T9SS type A sorting domain-containing protein [Rubrivirga sp.]|uniref:T9SS type A sorting domain-containing protein n=1 Tax=Rubrivirga sp. TaxID=1885344 RepID=UPI003B52042C
MTHVTRALVAALLVLGTSPLSAQTLVPDDDVPGTLVESGYNLRLGVGGLNYPSGITFGDGRAWVSEAGFPGVPPTVKEVTFAADTAGTALAILTPGMFPDGMVLPPFTDVTWRDGMLWLSHRQVGANGWKVGAISRFDPDDPVATFETVLTNLPSVGDHATNAVVFGADGRAYFGQGSATNSGVVGADNDWVADAPEFREIAPVEITLDGDEFTTVVPFFADPEGDDVTAPYRPFGSGPIDAGFVVPAATPDAPQDGMIIGTASVYSFDPDADDAASTLRLEAWGFRNPFGLAFDAQDPTRLFVSNNGSDIRGQPGDPNDPLDPETFVIRGTRPIAGDQDDMFVLTVGGDVEFFGWPDFFHDPQTDEVLSVGDDRFCMSPVLDEEDCPSPVFADAFRDGLTVEPAFTAVGQFVSVTGFSPSTSAAFGFPGDLFVTESGSFSPQTGAFAFTGYKVSRIDRETGEEVDFVVNDGDTPEELFVPEAFNKPVMAAFMGDQLAIVDLGVLEPGINLFQSNTGKVWLLTNMGGTASENRRASDGTALRSVYPNPVADVATVAFDLGVSASVRLSVVDVLGREVAVAAQGVRPAGSHTATVPTAGLPAGVYVVRLEVEGRVQSQRFTVAR